MTRIASVRLGTRALAAWVVVVLLATVPSTPVAHGEYGWEAGWPYYVVRACGAASGVNNVWRSQNTSDPTHIAVYGVGDCKESNSGGYFESGLLTRNVISATPAAIKGGAYGGWQIELPSSMATEIWALQYTYSSMLYYPEGNTPYTTVIRSESPGGYVPPEGQPGGAAVISFKGFECVADGYHREVKYPEYGPIMNPALTGDKGCSVFSAPAGFWYNATNGATGGSGKEAAELHYPKNGNTPKKLLIGIKCFDAEEGYSGECRTDGDWKCNSTLKVSYPESYYYTAANVEGANCNNNAKGEKLAGSEPEARAELVAHSLETFLVDTEYPGVPKIAGVGWSSGQIVNPGAAACGGTTGCLEISTEYSDNGGGIYRVFPGLDGTEQSGVKLACEGTYTTVTPCPVAGTSNVSVTGLGALENESSHSLTVTAEDLGQAQGGAHEGLRTTSNSTLTVTIEKVPPTCGGGHGPKITSAPAGVAGAKGGTWIRGEYTVSGEVCDSLSGVSHEQIVYETAPWNEPTKWSAEAALCTTANVGAANSPVSGTCTGKTEGLTEGGYIRWCIRMQGRAWPEGPWSSCPGEGWSSERRIDNTSPEIRPFELTEEEMIPPKPPPEKGGDELSTHGWTNEPTWYVEWPKVTDTCKQAAVEECEGVGISGEKGAQQYEIASRCETGETHKQLEEDHTKYAAKGSGYEAYQNSDAAEAPTKEVGLAVGRTNIAGTETQAVSHNGSEACEQGFHEISVRARDKLDETKGTWGPWRHYTYFYDNNGPSPHNLKVTHP